MIILYNPYGDHSNRLFQNLHFEAFCYQNNIQYYNAVFSDMAPLYKNPVKVKYRFLSKILRNKYIRLLQKNHLIKNVISFDGGTSNNSDILLNNKNRLYFVEGWCFRAYNATKELRELFREKYALKDEYFITNELYNRIIKIKKEGSLVVGVHIRRGDYATFANGAYFYTDAVYKKIMDRVNELLLNRFHKKIYFVVFSNDSVEFDDCSTIISENSWYVDQYLMTFCDYLIGPPSTFTMWASYIGKVPYFHIDSPECTVILDKFRICDG